MAELGSTGGNLDNILQYLLQRIEQGVGGNVIEGVTHFADLSDVPAITGNETKYWGWNGRQYDWLNAPEVVLSDYVKKGDVRTFSIFNSDGTSLLYEFNPLGESNQEMCILTADDVKTMTWYYYDSDGNRRGYKYNPLGKTDGELDFTAGLVSAVTYNEHVKTYNTFVEKFDSMFELTKDGKIKAKMSFFSVEDISAYGDANSQIPSAEVSVIAKYKEGIEIATINGTSIYAPNGGTADLKDYATIQWVNENFFTEKELDTWIGRKGYATEGVVDSTAQGYANSALATAKSYANETFVTKAGNWEVIDGIKMLNGTYTFFKTLYIEPETSYGAYIGWQNGPAAMNILTNGRIKFRQGIQDNIELYGGKDAQNNDIPPFFDFHFNDTVTDFSSRIIESAQGILEIQDSTQLSGTLKIGNAYITYDSENNAIFVKGKDGASVNLVATGDVAAYSGLGSGFDTLTDLTLTNKLTVKTIACSGDAVIDGELECTGEITTAYMSTDDITIGNSIILNDDYIFMGLSNGAYIEFSTDEHTSQLSDVWAGKELAENYVYLTIDGNTYRISATKL